MSSTPRVSAPPSYHTPHAPGKPREAVLVVLHDDGWIEAYAERHVDVRIITMPHMTTPEGERLADEYLGLTLPKRYRDLFWPSNRRAADLVRVITMQDIAQQKWEMEMMKTLDNITARNRKGGEVWIV